MSRPLVGTVKHDIDADAFHKEVFAAHGHRCHFHGKKFPYKRKPEERCQKDATDAMHIVPRSQLGPKSRFACGEENGRPGCRPCHDLQETGKIDFDDRTYNAAIRALKKVTPKIGLRER